MNDEQKPKPPFDRAPLRQAQGRQGGLSKVERPRRRRPWKIVGRALVALVIGAVAVIALAPTFTPSSLVRRQVTEALAESLGRPVTVDSARFGWTTGLEVRGLVIQAGGGSDATLAKADRVSARFGPLESLKAAFGGRPPMDSLRVEGLEVWLVFDGAGGEAGEGRWNFEAPEVAAAGAAAKPPRLIQVTDGTIHFENKVLGRSLTLKKIHASLGQLESTGQGYISLAAELPGTEAGLIHLNAGLDSLDLGGRRRPSGGFNIEWSGVPWSEVAAAVSADPRVVRAAGQTSGACRPPLRRAPGTPKARSRPARWRCPRRPTGRA